MGRILLYIYELVAIKHLPIELILKIFTIIGSLLGAIAFFQNFSKDIVLNNKEKWKKMTEIITVSDFDNLQYQITARQLRGNLLEKLEHLIYEIEKQNLDIVGFKSFLKNKIEIELANLKNLYKNLRQLIQVPFWNPCTGSDGKFGYEFDKNVFYEDADKSWTQLDFDNATREYAKH
jgi:hypothetical protein